MSVAGRYGHFAQLIGQTDDSAVDIAQPFFILYQPFPDEELIIGQGLDFQIIIIRGYLQQFFIGQVFLHHRADQLPCFTGRPQNQTFAVFVEHRPGNAWPPAVDIFQVGNADQFV